MKNGSCACSLPCQHGRKPNPPGIRSFDVLCAGSGDYNTCSETATGSSFAHWHTANITLNVSSRAVNISYNHDRAVHMGRIDEDFSTMAWATAMGGAALWSRQSGTEVADCCAHCTANKNCSVRRTQTPSREPVLMFLCHLALRC